MILEKVILFLPKKLQERQYIQNAHTVVSTTDPDDLRARRNRLAAGFSAHSELLKKAA